MDFDFDEFGYGEEDEFEEEDEVTDDSCQMIRGNSCQMIRGNSYMYHLSRSRFKVIRIVK